jgi:hypothetical protein
MFFLLADAIKKKSEKTTPKLFGNIYFRICKHRLCRFLLNAKRKYGLREQDDCWSLLYHFIFLDPSFTHFDH